MEMVTGSDLRISLIFIINLHIDACFHTSLQYIIEALIIPDREKFTKTDRE